MANSREKKVQLCISIRPTIIKIIDKNLPLDQSRSLVITKMLKYALRHMKMFEKWREVK